jgi:hypothetical protein
VKAGATRKGAAVSDAVRGEDRFDDRVREQLDRILSSRTFSRSTRQRQMLRFLTDRYLQGSGATVAEADIGVAVFGKRVGYDTSRDRTVGPAGLRLRHNVPRYYATEGRGDPLLFLLPRRGYGLEVEERSASDSVLPTHVAKASGPPVDYRVEAGALITVDARGRELWQWQFETALATDAYSGLYRHRRCAFADIDRDGRIETLFAAWPLDFGERGTHVYCFSEGGELRWGPVATGRYVRTDEKEYRPPYLISNVMAVPCGRERLTRVLVSNCHYAHSANQIALLEPLHGKLLSEYWHAGHLPCVTHADLDADGSEEVLLAGVNNGYGQATLVVFDSADISGASRQIGRRWLGIPTGSERDVVLFPRTCLSELKPHSRAVDMRLIPPGRMMVVVSEDIAEAGTDGLILYELDYHLNVLSAESDTRFRTLHRQRELAGGHAWSGDEARRLIASVKYPLRGRSSFLNTGGPPGRPRSAGRSS